jgi:hypothetical protein
MSNNHAFIPSVLRCPYSNPISHKSLFISFFSAICGIIFAIGREILVEPTSLFSVGRYGLTIMSLLGTYPLSERKELRGVRNCYRELGDFFTKEHLGTPLHKQKKLSHWRLHLMPTFKCWQRDLRKRKGRPLLEAPKGSCFFLMP